jgi:hypothetical protein
MCVAGVFITIAGAEFYNQTDTHTLIKFDAYEVDA